MKLVSCFGAVRKLSDRDYRKMLEEISREGGCDFDKYGKLVGNECIDVTDMSVDEADDRIADLKAELKRK